MDFDNESSSPSPSSSSSSSPCTTPNPSSHSDSSSRPQIPSHKRKAGRKKFQETRHPLYRGVRRRNGNKWVCEVREPNKKSRIWLGTYRTPEMAARAHDVAVLALRGSLAVLNFPDSALLLPVASSSSAKDIRAAAAKAAEAFRPSTSSSLSMSSSSSSQNSFCRETKCENIKNPCLIDEKNQVLDYCCLKSMHNVEFEGAEKNNNDDQCRTMFFDEEALYNMPGMLDSMAEGLLLSPPSMERALDWDDISCEMDLTLWED